LKSYHRPEKLQNDSNQNIAVQQEVTSPQEETSEFVISSSTYVIAHADIQSPSNINHAG